MWNMWRKREKEDDENKEKLRLREKTKEFRLNTQERRGNRGKISRRDL